MSTATATATANEIAVICAIATSEYQDGSPEDFDALRAVWSSGIECGLPASSVPGVIASLRAKGLVTGAVTGPVRERTVALTRAGHAGYLAQA